MIHYDSRTKLIAVCLATVAGYVDALGFVELGGFFVSFMSGNSTRAGVSLAEGTRDAALALLLIAGFLLGVVAGSLIGHRAGPRRRRTILWAVAVALAVAALLGLLGHTIAAAVVMAAAMGAENGIFERDGEVSIGLTYMTGTLVKLGQRLTAALLGGDRWAWRPYFFLWLGLTGGAVAGGLVHQGIGLQGLWIAVVALAGLSFVRTP